MSPHPVSATSASVVHLCRPPPWAHLPACHSAPWVIVADVLCRMRSQVSGEASVCSADCHSLQELRSLGKHFAIYVHFVLGQIDEWMGDFSRFPSGVVLFTCLFSPLSISPTFSLLPDSLSFPSSILSPVSSYFSSFSFLQISPENLATPETQRSWAHKDK